MLHDAISCIQNRPIQRLEDAVSALPEISAQLKVATKIMEEVATLMRESGVNQTEIRHLGESDKKQWEKLDSFEQRINDLAHQPGSFALKGLGILLAAVGSVVGGIVVGMVLR